MANDGVRPWGRKGGSRAPGRSLENEMNRALLVGINAYAKQTGLAGCVNDVLDLARLLVSRRCVDEEDVVLLLDARATKAAIIDALIGMVDALQPGDRGYFHFSGHGVRMPAMNPHGGMSEVVCPHDFDWRRETSFTDSELLVILNALPLGAQLFVSLDTCHSGDFARGLGLRGQPRTLTPPSGAPTRGPSPRGFRTVARAPNVTFLSACSPWQTATDTSFDGRPNGAFSYFLHRALEENARGPLGAAISSIEKPLQDYGMTPAADNAGVPYLVDAPAVTAARAGLIVFERQWQTTLLGQPVGVDARVAVANGELTVIVGTRAGGHTMLSPPIRITGNLTCPIQLGIFDIQLVLTVADWTYGRGTIDFVLHLELVNDRAFVPRTRMPVHIDVTQLTCFYRTHVAQPRDVTEPIVANNFLHE